MKDYKVDKASLSASFCQEVYQVVREIPVGKVSTYGGNCRIIGNASMFPYGGACFETDSGWFICALSPGCQCIGTPCSGLDRAETTLVGRRDLFQAKWMRRLEKASLELLRIWMKFAYLIYFPYLCANNMQEQTVIYLWKYCFLLFIERIILSNSIPFKLLSLFSLTI